MAFRCNPTADRQPAYRGLDELREAIARNDNRAPFRSRLLLEQDHSTLGVSFGRIYDDLGFEQAGRTEAAKALAVAPASAEAHRFLADLELTRPRLEAARLSELLQSQLLQSVGFNLIQPSLSTPGLNLVAPRGPAAVTFNEFTPLFQGDGLHAIVSGLAGNHDTWGQEATAAAVRGRTSLSVGQLFYRSNGFRKNFDLQDKVVDVLAQAQLTEWVQVQAGYQRRRSRVGDRELKQDLDSLNDTINTDIRGDLFRFGVQLTPTPRQTTLFSLLYDDRERNALSDETPRGGFFEDGERNASAVTMEGKHIALFDWGSLVSGGSVTHVDDRNRICFSGRCDGELNDFGESNVTKIDDDQNAYELYGQVTRHFAWDVDLILRGGYDRVDGEKSNTDGLTPGIGLIWAPKPGVTMRAAAARTIKRPFVAGQTLRPTQLAGFNTLFDDIDGVHSDSVGLAFDYELSANLRVGAEVVRRWLRGRLNIETDAGMVVRVDDQREDAANVYMNWTPTDRWAVSLGVTHETYRAKERDTTDEAVRLSSWLPSASVRYFHPRGWFGGVGTVLARQGVDRSDPDVTDSDEAALVDAFVGFRLPRRLGLVSLEANNLFDQRLNWQDDTFRSSQEELRPQFLPARSLIARLTLNW